MSGERPVFSIAIGCDCDPDRPEFGGGSLKEGVLSWRGIELGIDRLRLARQKFADQTGLWPKFTWNVRADFQIDKICKSAGNSLSRHHRLWRTLIEEGDEIAWHPHLWACDEKNGFWFQSIGDHRFEDECLQIGYDGFVSAWGSPPHSVHAGWCYQDNNTISILSEKGLKVDCSAVPGFCSLGLGGSDQSDWSQTGFHPYRPAANDYQRAATSDETELDILEIPASVGSSIWVRLLGNLRDRFKRRSFRLNRNGISARVPLIATHPWLNAPIACDAVNRAIHLKQPYFFSYSHCDEFLDNAKITGRGYWVYDIEYIFTNILRTIDEVQEKGFDAEFVTISELGSKMRM